MSVAITVEPGKVIERILTLELVRVTERAAVASARLRGKGNEKAADQAAVDAMRRELNKLPIDGTVVIGEGELDEAPMLFIGEKVGSRNGPKVDIAVDPLEGTTLCAKDMPGSIAVMAMAEADISLESILQKRSEAAATRDPHGRSGAPVPLVLITYAATEAAIRSARDKIAGDGLISEPPQVIRIERE